MTPTRVSPHGRFGPLAADHPGVGDVCPECGVALAVGDRPALYEVGPADDDEATKAAAGRAYTAECVIGHEWCP